MRGIAEFWRRLRGLARRREREERLAEEMEFHVEMKRREYLESGMREEGARAAARRDTGSVARVLEDSREIWGFARLEALWQDARYAWRTLRRSPGFALAAMVGSGLAVGAVTAVFSVVDAALLRPLPYREPERLVVVWDQLRALGFMRFPVSIPNFLDYRQERLFEQVEAWAPGSATVRIGEQSQRMEAGRGTAGLLALLGDRTALGRWFVAEENQPGRGATAVLSDRVWRRWFGGDRSILGARILIDEEPHEVVGVLPGAFRFLPAGFQEPEVWLPLAVGKDGDRNRAAVRLIARLAGGVTVGQAASRMREAGRRLAREHRVGMGPHGEDGGFSISVTPLREELYGTARPALYAVSGATLVLLLMGCANTAFLWLTRASGRRQELAVRMALGAGVARLAQHRIVEGVLVALGGAVIWVAAAGAAVRTLRDFLIQELPVLSTARLDRRVLLFTALVSGAIGVLCSALPLWRVRGGRDWNNRSGTAGVKVSRMRSGLIAAQAGLTCTLLAAALLLGRSLVKLLEVDPGFRRAGLITAQVSLPPRYREPAQISGYHQRLLEQLEARLGGGAATLTSRLPLSFGPGGDPFSIEGRPYQTKGPVPQMTHAQAVGPGYFSVLGIAVLAGRAFEDRDFAGEGSVAVISRRLAEGFWPGRSPLGERLVLGAPRPGARWATIIGVVGDVRTENLTREVVPQIYFPYQRAPGRSMAVVVKGGDGAVEEVRREVSAVDPGAALFAVATMEERLAGAVSGPRMRVLLFGGYTALAVALAVFGVYSLTSYSVACRTRELAVRVALGATARGVVAMLLGEALRLVAAGAACGLGMAAALSGALRTLLFGVAAVDGWSYGLAAVLVVGACTAAALVPAWRATRVAPARVLQDLA